MEKDSNEYKTDLDSEACYRACRDAGMTDPETTIPKMVEALRMIADNDGKTLLDPESYTRRTRYNDGAAAAFSDCASTAKYILSTLNYESGDVK